MQARLLQLVDRVVARVVELRFRGNDLVEQLALTVLLARLHVRLRHRDGFAERPAALGRDDYHAGAGRTLEHECPFLVCEVSSSSHRLLLSDRHRASLPANRARRPPPYEPRSIRKARITKNHSNPVTWCPEPQSQKAA